MEEKKEVIVTGLKIPFWDLVWFMVKLAFASIPAIFIIWTIVWIFSLLFGLLFSVMPGAHGPGF